MAEGRTKSTISISDFSPRAASAREERHQLQKGLAETSVDCQRVGAQ